MKLFCTQSNLNKSLGIVEKAISRSSTLPILSNILLETDKGRLKLSATDLEIGINLWLGSQIDKPGNITVPARLLLNFINSLPNKKIDISTRGNTLNLKCEQFKASIKGLSAKDFPLIPVIKEKPLAVVSVPSFQRALSQVVSAVSVSQTRPEISGVLMQFKDKEIKIAATDSYRLAEKKVLTRKKVAKEVSLIVPARTIHELIRIFSEQEGDLDIILGDTQILFKFSSINLVSRLIEGQYPDYAQIIPDKFKTKALVETKEIQSAIKIASLFASKTDEVRLKFKKPAKGKPMLEILSESDDKGSNISQIQTKINGNSGEIIFNYNYLLDGLSNILTDFVEIAINNDKTPAVLKPFTPRNKREKDKDYLYLIMPIKN